MRYFVIDIETNRLRDPDIIWCVVIKDLLSKKVWSFTDKDQMYLWWYDYMNDQVQFIGQNIIEFDVPVLRHLWGIDIPDENLIDTLIMSRLHSPNIQDGHSLEAWGKRLEFPKGDFHDFSSYSEEMLKYCIQDVELTARLYSYLKDQKTFCLGALDLEHKLAIALKDAKNHGFYFDTNSAINIKAELEVERDKLDTIIHAAYLPTLVGKRVIKEVPFNPNSSKQVIDKLWEAGWKPTEKTDGHKQNTDVTKTDRYKVYGWKLNENNLSTLPADAPEAARSILKRTIYETRIRKLVEWLNLVDEDTGAIHGDIIGIGTWTHRMAHRHPNLANIAAKKSIKYHTEELNSLATTLGGRMRALWLARPGKVLVGTDAEGIQLRVLAHYMNDKEFIDAVCSGSKDDKTDPHSLNQQRIGLGTRDNAKTFIYAFLLGAGDRKIGEIYNISTVAGKRLKSSFIESYPGLKQVKTDRIPSDAYRGYTYGLDGRIIYCDSEHLMMAAYLQAGEAIIMKYAVVWAVSQLKFLKVDAKLINVVHDEMLFECAEEDAEQVRKVTEYSIWKAGDILNLRCPMKGEGKIGRTWLEVH